MAGRAAVRRAVYPGTFDPITLGHLDVIERATALFEGIIVLVADNPAKEPWFSASERVAMIQEEVAPWPEVSVRAWRGLVVDFMRQEGIRFMLRGLRTVSDFEYEYQMAMTNRSLLPGVDTVFMMPSLEHSFTSSRLIKEVVQNGGDVTRFVSPRIAARLRERIARTGWGQARREQA